MLALNITNNINCIEGDTFISFMTLGYIILRIEGWGNFAVKVVSVIYIHKALAFYRILLRELALSRH